MQYVLGFVFLSSLFTSHLCAFCFWERRFLFLLFTSHLFVLCFLVSTLEIIYTSGSIIRPSTIASTFVVFTLCLCLCVGYITTHLKPFALNFTNIPCLTTKFQQSQSLSITFVSRLEFQRFGLYTFWNSLDSSMNSFFNFEFVAIFFLCNLFISIAFLFYFMRIIHCS